MKNRVSVPVLFFSCFLFLSAAGQSAAGQSAYSWWDPATNPFPVIEGQAWPKERLAPYDRLPARAEKTVTNDVWGLSRQSAGLYIKFRTNASNLVVRYGVKGGFAMPHMPSTGVSGVDLYAIDINGRWLWAPGKYSFGDTVEYRFKALDPGADSKDRDVEYRLFLPLYNTVSWMQIGVPAGTHFSAVPVQPEKPVVIYGTSIAQGGCASRPGLAWPAILERGLDRPLINLGFSGNGRLDPAVTDLLAEIDAKIYVLDCLPNLTGGYTADVIDKKLEAAVRTLQTRRPGVPILLVEHSGGNGDQVIDSLVNKAFRTVNEIFRASFARLQAAGITNIYSLSTAEIGFDMEATVDGVHPNDHGMLLYAAAYEKKIRSILHEETGDLSTEKPVMQTRDGYDWRARHDSIIELNRQAAPRNLILANSIMHYWGGRPVANQQWAPASWNKWLEPAGLRNQAYGWDRIENVLWRVYHEELDGFTAKHVILMIGTNNLGSNTDAEILSGLRRLLGAIRVRQPGTTILLSGIFPRRGKEERIVGLNKAIAELARGDRQIQFINPGLVLLTKEGKANETLLSDGLHPNAAGYERLGPVIAGYLKD